MSMANQVGLANFHGLDICHGHGGLQVGRSCSFLSSHGSFNACAEKKLPRQFSRVPSRWVPFSHEIYRTSPYITIYKWSVPPKKKWGLRWFSHIVFIVDSHIIYIDVSRKVGEFLSLPGWMRRWQTGSHGRVGLIHHRMTEELQIIRPGAAGKCAQYLWGWWNLMGLWLGYEWDMNVVYWYSMGYIE